MKEINGDARVFVVINTTEYNNDGKWCVQTASFAQLPELGFTTEDLKTIDGITVGWMVDHFDYKGVLVIRIA